MKKLNCKSAKRYFAPEMIAKSVTIERGFVASATGIDDVTYVEGQW